MIVIVVLFGIILILGLLVFLGKYIYYYFYPNETVENLIANASLVQDISLAGQNGKNGDDGNLGDLAINGLNGKHGEKGELGVSGQKSLVVGTRGVSGISGLVGPHGSGGAAGVKGNPSNSLIPYVSYSQDNNDNLAPIVFEHNFSYNDEIHKLTASFVFDDITHFSFKNGPTNTRFKIDTSGPDYYDIPVISPTGKARRIYANLRVVLERRVEGFRSDGIIFYSSAPINRSGYLIASDVDLTKSSRGVNRLDEIVIDLNREFGLDFTTVDSTTLSYNYLLSGLARYRVIFNIDPPLTGIKVRLEERFSPNPLSDFAVPSLNTESKGNLIKLKSDEDIYMLSPPFETGKVVLKDSSNPNSMWKMQNFTNLSDSIAQISPELIGAFDFLENDINTFKDNLNKAKTILVAKQFYRLDTIQNLLIRLKSSDPKPLPEPTSSYTIPLRYEGYSTRAVIDNLYFAYPNTDSPLTYPSELKSAILFMGFTVRINIKNIDKVKYIVYLEDNNPLNVVEVSNTNSFVIDAVDTGSGIPSLPYNSQKGYLYYNVNLDNQAALDFASFFGRRMIIKFSLASMEFESHIGNSSEFDNDADTRFTAHPLPSPGDFEDGDSEYDFLNNGNHIWGFDVKFSATKFDVVEDSFIIGYKGPVSGIKFQRVIGFRQSNGDYILDVPSNGY